MRNALRNQRLVALCVAGAVLLNFPLLTLWDSKTTVFGLPLMPVALFVGWAILIGIAAWIVESKRRLDKDADDEIDKGD
jgi:hypothetical protein